MHVDLHTVAVNKKFTFRFEKTIVLRCESFCSVTVFPSLEFTLTNNSIFVGSLWYYGPFIRTVFTHVANFLSVKLNVDGESRMLAFISQSSLFPESNTSSQGAVRSNRFDLSPVSTATSCKCESKYGFKLLPKAKDPSILW